MKGPGGTIVGYGAGSIVGYEGSMESHGRWGGHGRLLKEEVDGVNKVDKLKGFFQKKLKVIFKQI